MKKRLLSIIILAFTILAINQSTVTASSSYADDKVSLGFLGYNWVVVLPEDRTHDRHGDPINEEWLQQLINELFDSDDSIKLVAMNYDSNYYLTFAYRYGGSLDALRDFSEEEIRSLNLSDYTDKEIIDSNLAGGISDNASNYSGTFDPSQNSVEEYGGVKYAVTSGVATIDGFSLEVKQYLTVVDGYYYVFTLYPFDGSEAVDYSSFKRVLANSYYKTSTTTADDASENTSTEVSNEHSSRKSALLTTTLTVLAAAACLAVAKSILKKGKKEPISNNVSDKSLKEDSSDGKITLNNELKELPSVSTEKTIPADEIRELKKLYDEGAITEEEFAAKKQQLLKL